MKKEHILVMRLSAQSDAAQVVPLVQALAAQYPAVRVTVLSRPEARPLYASLAPNVGFMEADVKGEYHGVRGLNTLYRRLAAKQFTHVADLSSVPSSCFLRLRFNIGRRHVEHVSRRRDELHYSRVFGRLGFPLSAS